MKVNFNVPLNQPDGTPSKKTAANAITECLYAAGSLPGQNNMSREDKYAAYLLMEKIRNAKEEVEISVEEAAMIKDNASIGLYAGAYGQIHDILEKGK
ncbi:MAG: hypothetical protein LIP08_03030 [Bacteroides sp.]|nr:hypothetical protein [Bacteroides sp.]